MKLRKIFAAVVLFLSAGTAMAQQMPAIPVDKNVKIGRLDNGLTYYIRHNSYPEHVASFYIAQKVGSINENDDQRGLAHLLEHLAFNGTDHFKGNSLQDYLQSIGVEYGRNLNAYTSVEKTVYYFTDVPTTRPTAVDSCMLILKDWSNGISLTEEAINDERDVVHNEYRMRIVGQQRMIERSLPKLYQGEKYGYRFPIGLMSVIDGCKPETLRAYYRKWYRPDNQAIIIVGDVDVNHIEAKIKELFSGIKVPKNAAKIEKVEVSDNDSAIYVIDKDKEQQVDLFQLPQDLLDQRVGHHRFQPQDFLAVQATPLAARGVETTQHAQQREYLITQWQAHGGGLVAKCRHAGSKRGTQQYGYPAQVDPQQEDWHRRQRAIDLLVTVEAGQVDAKAPANQFQQHGGQQRTSDGVAQADGAVWHHAVDGGDGQEFDEYRRHIQGEGLQHLAFGRGEHGQFEEARRQCQRGRRHQRA